MLRQAIPKLGDLEARQIHQECHVRPTKSMKAGNLHKWPAKQSLHPSGPNWGMCTLKPAGDRAGRSEDLQWAQNTEDSSGEGRSSTGLLLKVCWGDLCIDGWLISETLAVTELWEGS